MQLTALNLSNAGLSEENKVQTPAFTDAVRLYRQAKGNYGTWEMMCGVPSQVSMTIITSIMLSLSWGQPYPVGMTSFISLIKICMLGFILQKSDSRYA